MRYHDGKIIINGLLLIIPFLLIRFGLLSALNKAAVKRAALFAPMYGNEMIAYWIYQISNIAIFVYLCFLKVTIDTSWLFYVGAGIYLSGLLLCAVSIKDFAMPPNKEMNDNGIYRFSRNPMYVAYFLIFAGTALLTKSWILFGIVVIFQVSAHWVIIAEERWCMEQFGESYRQYMKKVRRYI